MKQAKGVNVKLLSLFSGIGAFEKALDNLGIDYELVGFSEIDKYATKSYCAIHGVDESKNLGDITKVDEKALPKDIDLVVYGFPCQDISNAGKMKGLFNEDGTPTRSGLFFEALGIIEETQPRVAIAENVKNLTGKKFKEQFGIVLESLENAGYNNYWKVLNAKDYGVPQNRERVFIVSIRKDIDNGMFQFPEGFELELRLKDVLEDEVDEKYYLSDDRIKAVVEHKKRNLENGRGFGARIVDGNDIASTVATSPDKSSCQYVRVLVNKPSVHQIGPLYGTDMEQNREGVCNAITTVQKDNYVAKPTETTLRIRKLTPKECFRLMGFADSDFEKAEAVNRNTQLYKQAGNSIVVPVSEHIIQALFDCGALEK